MKKVPLCGLRVSVDSAWVLPNDPEEGLVTLHSFPENATQANPLRATS